MTPRLTLMSNAAVSLLVMVAVSACGAQSGAGSSAGQTPAPQTVTTAGVTDSAGMADMDHATMPGMDHTAMPGMDHGAMAGGASAPPGAPMDHSNMAGMAPAARAATPAQAMDHGSMTGMDHSTMQGMDHSSTAGMTPAPRSAPSAGTMDHSSMQGMDHSAMAGMDHSTMSGMAPSPAGMVQGSAMDHSSMSGMTGMEGMSGMSGMAGMSAPPSTGTALAASSPDAGAMIQGSPGAISLTLPQRMTLQSLSLSNAVGQRIPLSATLPDAPVETFTTPAPPLPAGSYTVAWTAATGTQTVNGTFGFMVH